MNAPTLRLVVVLCCAAACVVAQTTSPSPASEPTPSVIVISGGGGGGGGGAVDNGVPNATQTVHLEVEELRDALSQVTLLSLQRQFNNTVHNITRIDETNAWNTSGLPLGTLETLVPITVPGDNATVAKKTNGKPQGVALIELDGVLFMSGGIVNDPDEFYIDINNTLDLDRDRWAAAAQAAQRVLVSPIFSFRANRVAPSPTPGGPPTESPITTLFNNVTVCLSVGPDNWRVYDHCNRTVAAGCLAVLNTSTSNFTCVDWQPTRIKPALDGQWEFYCGKTRELNHVFTFMSKTIDPSESCAGSVSKTIIIAAAVGGVLVVVILLVGVYLLVQHVRNKKRKQMLEEGPDDTETLALGTIDSGGKKGKTKTAKDGPLLIS